MVVVVMVVVVVVVNNWHIRGGGRERTVVRGAPLDRVPPLPPKPVQKLRIRTLLTG